MSSNRRRSSRCNNATNLQGQKTLGHALKKRALSPRAPVAATLQHYVLPEQLRTRITDFFDRYAKHSPQLEQRSDGADSSGGATGRGNRRGRGAADLRTAAGSDEGADGDELVDQAAAAATAATLAVAAARNWELEGQQCLELLEPVVTSRVTPSKDLQEYLMHMVLNAGNHPGGLAARAYTLLERLLEAHPPTKLEDGTTLVVNENLWEPVGCTWASKCHQLPGCRLEGLKQAAGLGTLLASAHNAAARAAAEAYRTSLPVCADAPLAGNVGDIMLLKYWVKILKADLDVRLGAAQRSGYGLAWRGQLENSLVVRMMQTITNWTDGTGSKPALVRHLAATVVYAHMAASHSAPLPAAAAAPVEKGGCSHAVQLICGPAEVGQLAATLLGMLYDVYDALDRMRAYIRLGGVGRDNDLIRMDLVLMKALLKDMPYKQPEHLQALLLALPPGATVRLLVALLADTAYRRSEDQAQTMDKDLVDLAWYYKDLGATSEPRPKALASDALCFLLEDSPPLNPHRGVWNWAAANILNTLADRAGLPLLLTTLVTAALRQAELEQRRKAEAAATAGAEGAFDGTDWAAEVGRVVKLYRMALQRMDTEGLGRGVPCAALGRRCADRLAARLEATMQA